MDHSPSLPRRAPAHLLLGDARFGWALSPLGDISLLAGPEGLRACWLQDHPIEALNRRGDPASHGAAAAHIAAAREQLAAYFHGSSARFDLALAPCGTPFQRRVWDTLSSIPHGQAISYARLAALCGTPKAFRAVGAANGRNPIPIIIPCHRVIAADGSLGGFSSGLDRKRALLALEGVEAKASSALAG